MYKKKYGKKCIKHKCKSLILHENPIAKRIFGFCNNLSLSFSLSSCSRSNYIKTRAVIKFEFVLWLVFITCIRFDPHFLFPPVLKGVCVHTKHNPETFAAWCFIAIVFFLEIFGLQNNPIIIFLLIQSSSADGKILSLNRQTSILIRFLLSIR